MQVLIEIVGASVIISLIVFGILYVVEKYKTRHNDLNDL